MTNHPSVPSLVGALTVGLALTVPLHGSEASLNTNYLTFSRPVALPGVTLAAGTYIFELAIPTNPDIVVVRDHARSRVYYLAFTNRANRPAGLGRDQVVTFGETRPGQPVPIVAWYPLGEPVGHSFVYDPR